MKQAKDFQLDSLARTVCEVESNLKDYLEITVILEVLGYSDESARALGYNNLFELAKDVEKAIDLYRWEESPSEPAENPRTPSGFRLFFAGMFYNTGWVIMLIALFLGGQSLWAAKDLPVGISTSIGLGVLLGLVSTGGVQQFSAWKLIYYHLQGNKPLARFIMNKNMVFGGIAIAITALAFYAVNFLIISFPPFMVSLTIYYLALIGIYRLLITPVYAFRKYVALVTCSIAALAVMLSFYSFLVINGLERVVAVVISQSLGMVVLVATGLFFSYKYIFSEREEREEDEPPFYSRPELPKNVKPPRYTILLYEGWPYILYGTLYFIFLFADRLVSWLGAGPFGLNYNRSYQIGVDTALLLLIPITGIKFSYLYKMSDFLEKSLKGIGVKSIPIFRKALLGFYKRMSISVIAFGFIFASFAFLLAEPIIQFALGTQESIIVFRWALLGILFFAFFLTNAVFSISFRKARVIVVILTIGCVLNYALSFFFSKSFDPWFAVFGFLISSGFLSISSTFYVLRLINRSEYTYYSAF